MPEKTFVLSIPVDASNAEGFDPSVPIKAVAKDSEGKWYSQTLKLDKSGKGEIKMEFEKNPGSLKIKLGPNDASEQEIDQLDTLELNVSARLWKKGEVLRRPVITIRPDLVELLWHWCRTFKINGKLICANGRPVPGATVHAFDVDFFWWWRSYQQVGTAVTDINGNFEITFRWCCHWYPWIWWRLRAWSLEPELVKKLKPILATKVFPLPIPESQPNFSIFEKAVGERIPNVLSPVIAPMSPSTGPLSLPNLPAAIQNVRNAFDPSILVNLGEKLRSQLPQAEALERLNIWPWYRFLPWRDCTPDIIFRATQPDGITENIIVNESYTDTRWNIPSTLNVTLVANDKALCLPIQDPVPGNCLKLLSVCLAPLHTIGGNIGNPIPGLNGYRDPGGNSIYSDQPFGGTMSIVGEFGDGTDADYYELQWNSVSKLPTEDWKPVPSDAISGFYRTYWGPEVPAVIGVSAIHYVFFPVEEIDGKLVIQTRSYYENQNNFLDGVIRWWMDPVETLIRWKTPDSFANGTYYLRFKTYKKVAGHLTETPILNQCGTNENNYFCVTTDNRIVGSGPTDPLGHACGSGTVHTCTDEPEAYILSIKQLGSDAHFKGDITPCSESIVLPDDLIQIDFIAHDPAGHLSFYGMEVTWGLNHISYPLSHIHSLNPLAPSPVPGIPSADFKGPDYPLALGQGASHPTWKGGTLRLIVRAGDVFPESCCYQLKLKVHKRTIVDCSNDLEHQTNTTIYTFTIRYQPMLPIVIPVAPISPIIPR